MERGNRESRVWAHGPAEETTRGERVEEVEGAVKYRFIASPDGGHIQMRLCDEWVQDHIEKITDGMTKGTRLRG